MSAFELDMKIQELRRLRNFESEIKAAISVIEESLKTEMTKRGTEELSGQNFLVTWKTITTRRFDSAAFKLTHSDLYNRFTKSSTSRRLVIA